MYLSQKPKKLVRHRMALAKSIYTGCLLASLTVVSVEVLAHQTIVKEVDHRSRHLVLSAKLYDLSDIGHV